MNKHHYYYCYYIFFSKNGRPGRPIVAILPGREHVAPLIGNCTEGAYTVGAAGAPSSLAEP